MKITKFKPMFITSAPSELEEGVLYISIPYKTVLHKCPCGCGEQVVLPLSPVQWKIIYDGETVTLHPSIGNWSYKCMSHYWIKDNRVIWADKWSEKKIRTLQKTEKKVINNYFNKKI